MTTGERLTYTMTELGVSIHELSRRTGLSLDTIRRMRRFDKYGTLHSWILVSEAMKTPLSKFAGYE